MKRLLLTLALMGVLCATDATVYYSQGSLVVNNLSSWNTSRTGGGSVPSSFTNNADEFVIQANHSMVTSAVWTVGSSSSFLKIENAGSLYGGHAILLTGNFQIFNGGIYYHDNSAAVTPAAGSSIFGGNEFFAANSTVEIRNWINNTTTLPASVNWGNLVLNYTKNIGGSWNQLGALTSIQGNFLIKNTGTVGQDFRLTTNTGLSLNIGGNLEIDKGTLYVKDGNAAGTTAVVQVNGSVTINTGAILNLGTVDFKPNNEFRFKGNMLAFDGASITAQSEESMLIANGPGVQSLYAPDMLNASFKIAAGSGIKLNSTLTLGSLRALVVAGTLIAGTNSITMNGGTLAVPGGVLNSRSKIDMKDGVCQVCQGNGTYSFSTQWCSTVGDTGVINFSSSNIQFNRSLASALKVGAMNSKGKLFLTDEAIVSFDGALSGPSPNRGVVELAGNGTLSFDEYSKVNGEAFYNGAGGILVIGAAAGLSITGPVGNIQVNGARNFNATGTNSYEFKSSLPQFAGNGFPSTITGFLKINNSSSFGVALSSAVSISAGATLQMVNGILTTGPSSLVTLQRGSNFLGGSSTSYINGPLRKFGEQDFTFHVGKDGRYAPVSLRANGGGNPTDVYTAEYFPGDPKSVYGNQLSQLIEHISSVEYWLINGTGNRLRFIKFPITPYSGVNHFPSLVIGYHDGIGWINLGNGTTSGSTTNGSIEVSAVNYGPFTFASTNDATNAMSISLPIHINSFTARRNGGSGILNWEISADTDADFFEVLASTDNRNYKSIATIPANDIQRTYQFVDATLEPGTTYYRIRVTEKNGNTLMSKIAALMYEKKGIELIALLPSVTTQFTNLSIASSDRDVVQLYITDLQGRQVRTLQLNVSQGTNSVGLDTKGLGAGIYYVYVVNKNGKSNVLRLLKQ